MIAYEFRSHREAREKFPETLFLILNEGQADLQARELILETVWAFEPEFLAQLTGLDALVFGLLQKLCEDANLAVLKIIEATCGVDAFVKAAIEADGRGHFIAAVDGEEIPVLIKGIPHFVYCVD